MKALLKILAAAVFMVVVVIGFNAVTADANGPSGPDHAYYDDGGLCPNPGESCAVVCYPSPCKDQEE